MIFEQIQVEKDMLLRLIWLEARGTPPYWITGSLQVLAFSSNYIKSIAFVFGANMRNNAVRDISVPFTRK